MSRDAATGPRTPGAGTFTAIGRAVGHFLYVEPEKARDYDYDNHDADDIENVHFICSEGDTSKVKKLTLPTSEDCAKLLMTIERFAWRFE